MPSPAACPGPTRLRELLEEAAPEADESALRDHLESCDTCLLALERLAADRALWEEATEQLGHPSRPESEETGPALRRAIEDLEARGFSSPERPAQAAEGDGED